MYVWIYIHISKYYIYMHVCICIYSLLHLECHLFFLNSRSIVWFSESLLLRSVEKRPMRLWLKIEIEWHSKCNWLDMYIVYVYMYVQICIYVYKYIHIRIYKLTYTHICADIMHSAITHTNRCVNIHCVCIYTYIYIIYIYTKNSFGISIMQSVTNVFLCILQRYFRYMYIHVYIYTCIYRCIHTHVYMCVCIHMWEHTYTELM